MKTKLRKWKRAENYAGENFHEYFQGPGKHRDSDALARSNFEAALDRLGGESETVIVEHAGHWAVGWVESILVHESDTEKVKELESIYEDLENYPVLDEEHFSETEREEREETFENFQSEFMDEIAKSLGLDDERREAFSDSLRCVASALFEGDCGYHGIEDGWVQADRMADHVRHSEYELKDLSESGDLVAAALLKKFGKVVA